MNYFSGIIPPEYTLNDAINDHNLVPYEYHPDVVSLSDSEIEAWNRLSREISIAIGKDKTGLDSSTRSDQIKLLMIRRARIAKKASGKEIAAQRLLRQHYRSGQRWLVYCEDGDQLRNVLRQTREWASEVMEYHSAMAGDSKATLKWFQDQGGILIAIACLDEGVNIPSISHALILASSQNPRQFIQRRGRILRRFPGKRVAVIHDVLVAPENVDDEPTQRSLMRSELRRAVEFADTSVNPSAKSALRIIAARAGIDPDTVDDVGTEEIDQPEG
jgi:superfamily II DNA or RNA helicase